MHGLRGRLVMTAALLGAPGWAAAQPAAEIGPQLDEVVVTATKTAQLLEDVPISISAYQQERMDRLGIRTVQDITTLTPGVQIEAVRERASGANISIRGVSSRIGAGTTGIYIDDAPIQVRIIGYDATNVYPLVFDLERVEVLRGPQGTLYGAGSMGGNVRFITPKPSLTRTQAYGRAEAATTHGGAMSYEAGAALGMPIIDGKLALRVSGWARREGGWVDRVAPSTGAMVDKNADYSDAAVFRAALAFAPTDALTITPSVFYQTQRVNDASAYWSNLSSRDDRVYRSGYPLRQDYEDHFVLPNLQVEYDFGPVRMTSSTSYFRRKAENEWDYSTVVPAVLSAGAVQTLPNYRAVSYFEDEQENLTQELRFQNTDPDARLTWVAGLYFGDMQQRNLQSLDAVNYGALLAAFGLPPSALPPLAQGPYGASTLLIFNKTVDRQYAAFGEANFKLTDKLTVTAGLRIARTELKFANGQAGPFNGPVTGGVARQKATPVTPKVSLQYDVDEDNMVYASAAKGYRIGGGNAALPRDLCRTEMDRIGITEAPQTYDSDTLWSYEVGAKNRLMGGRLQINSSAFLIDWKEIQQQVFLRCAFQYVENVGGARSKGFDVQARFKATDDLTLGASVGYVDAKYTSDAFPNDNIALQPLVGDGDSLGVQPWTLVLTADYDRPLGDDRSIYANATLAHLSRDKDRTPFLDPRTISYDPTRLNAEASTVVNVRLGYRIGSIDMSAFAKNLLNANDRLTRNHDQLRTTIFKETSLRPRVVGVTATYRY
jgi:outer membrane receptor protein involved in Fe transport